MKTKIIQEMLLVAAMCLSLVFVIYELEKVRIAAIQTKSIDHK